MFFNEKKEQFEFKKLYILEDYSKEEWNKAKKGEKQKDAFYTEEEAKLTTSIEQHQELLGDFGLSGWQAIAVVPTEKDGNKYNVYHMQRSNRHEEFGIDHRGGNYFDYMREKRQQRIDELTSGEAI